MSPRSSAPGRGRADRRAALLPGHGPLARTPPVVGALAVLAVLVLAVVLGGPAGTVLLGLLALAGAVLLATTWARLNPAERAGRVLALGLLVAVAALAVAR